MKKKMFMTRFMHPDKEDPTSDHKLSATFAHNTCSHDRQLHLHSIKLHGNKEHHPQTGETPNQAPLLSIRKIGLEAKIQ